MAIKNHRALKTLLVEKLPSSADRERSIMDIKRASILFNGKDINTITAGMGELGNELIFKTACDEVLKGTSNIVRQRHYQEFLRLYLHTNGIFGVGAFSIMHPLDNAGYVLDNQGVESKLKIYLRDKDLYIEDEFFLRKLTNSEAVPIIKPGTHDYFVHGKTQFKLEVIEKNRVWIPRLVILQSTLDCPDPYFRKIVDQRSFLQKLVDFLKAIFRMATHTVVPISTFFKPPSNTTSVQPTNLPQFLNSTPEKVLNS
ncbi:hypothetical protein [Rickettsiella endosymbiont of Dermanyssus gallinae]|uniref:hypothetical protein n=1 Tax=Rickettsiella endosymbiont of Dermanyssus gallinae TaxID=2856608 RepID=UPI001C5289F8|nr:hypothetical protein [Rickettsiella endosymbiont of Dermanyssus gallinae]